MPLLDIATSQPSFHSHVYQHKAQAVVRGKFVFGNDKSLTSAWNSFQIPTRYKRCNLGHIETQGSRLVIRAIATLERKSLRPSKNDNESLLNQEMVSESESPVVLPQSISEDSDSEELDEREKLRRMRISKANKGNTPWNKGRKHSAETLQRIRERTRLAMQNPKVKMKLINLGHAQSEETRIKIGVGVRIGWERRREKLMLQETCHFDWKNLVAEASRKGFGGEKELQWDSYEILDKELEREWLESVEQRKNTPRPKGSKRAPKSAEQRRKISEAISAKWADPGYRDRVCSALAVYHGTPVGAERKPRRRPSGDRPPRIRSPPKKKVKDTDNLTRNEMKVQSQRSRLRRSNMPLYKDPLASSKLEMIKNIRAQRASSETKKTEAIERAKLLIAEAEKAAKALEIAAIKSPVAQASLTETRKLIAEAIQSIESIKAGQIDDENGRSPSLYSTTRANYTEDEKAAEIESLTTTEHRKVNGFRALESSKSDSKDFNFGKLTFQDLFNGGDHLPVTNLSDNGSLDGDKKINHGGSGETGLAQPELDIVLKQSTFTQRQGEIQPNGNDKQEKMPLLNGSKIQFGEAMSSESTTTTTTTTKKWVRGRLVDVAEAD